MAEHRKIFVVSDIHGHCTPLINALAKAGFDKNEPSHLLVCCGDYFDRGDESLEVLEFFEGLPRKVLLRGNHEDMLMKLLTTGMMLPHHYVNGSQNTLKSMLGDFSIDPIGHTVDFSGNSQIVERFCRFIRSTVDYFETRNYVFVHGWLPENVKTPEALRAVPSGHWDAARIEAWVKHYNGTPPLPGKTLICGHVPTFLAGPHDPDRDESNADIFYGNRLIAIDAGTADSKQINVLVLEDELI